MDNLMVMSVAQVIVATYSEDKVRHGKKTLELFGQKVVGHLTTKIILMVPNILNN